ncbi:PHP domain-containing protein [Actinocrispum wychmicini]|uniref:Secreted protein n=1 Tax=Actinocrispum wychmicini TaxID=1213861 RepID=A0A4R2J573_9PSEU|nr:PHP domain-containing protein [Actinocrispum wychmicini]TCO52482.1 secreted protein [Actinocrispum wychmicini]
MSDRRRFLKRAGMLGAAVALGGTTPAVAAPLDLDIDVDLGRLLGRDRFRWLAGDHHTHTQYSYDAMYTVDEVVGNALRYGADWLVITDHGYPAHEKSSVEATNADIRAARRRHPGILLWHGMEWNVPSAEHATVFFAPGANEASLLRTFEHDHDSRLQNDGSNSPANETRAVDAVQWLKANTRDPIVVVNHPTRNGRVAPHELRALRDTGIVIGMEGAPGAQADGFPQPNGNGGHRGGYGNSPGADSWPGFPVEAYRTYGGFDWMTATLGGVWDSLLADGKGFWITSNSDAHYSRGDHLVRPAVPDGYYDQTGKYPDPIHVDTPQILAPYADFFPAQFSRTVVGATHRTFTGVTEGLRSGRVWITHGGLADNLEFSAYSSEGRTATIGGRLRVRRGANVTVVLAARLASCPNASGSIPRLRRLDLIQGPVTGPSTPDAAHVDGVTVAESFEPRWWPGNTVFFKHTFRNVRAPFYVRLRGTDGNRHTPNGIEPIADIVGQSDPFQDLWCYTNPIFIDM